MRPCKPIDRPCYKCGCEYRPELFVIRTNGRRHSWCIPCQRKGLVKSRTANPDKVRIWNRQQYIKPGEKEKRLAYNTARYHRLIEAGDFSLRLEKSLRFRLYFTVTKRGFAKADGVKNLVGCSQEQLIEWIAAQFLSGMSWDNYGAVWELDHIKPCAIFNLSDRDQQRECFHFTNLQPLWKSENRRKGGRYLYPQ